MHHTVVWEDAALGELTDVWLQSTDQSAVSAAANQVDPILRSDPATKGTDFYGDRLLIIDPIRVVFTVIPDDLMVKVLHVWSI
jgi:hypothetical protein